MQLIITEEHIKKALEAKAKGAWDRDCCPTAQALKELTGMDCAVYWNDISMKGTAAKNYTFGAALKAEIINFSRHHTFKPGTYELEVA